MKAKLLSAALVLTMLVLLSLGPITAQEPEQRGVVRPNALTGTAFTYQGRLIDDGAPVDDSCDFQFALWDDPITGTLAAGPLDLPTVSVTDGRFTVQLDFGDLFDGTAFWLEIAVKCTGDADYVTLSPRQELTAAPYALHALSAWSLKGNANTDPAANFLGTTDGMTLTLAVSGTAALRLAPNAVSPNLVGGYGGNSVAAGVVAATIGGGGDGDGPNRVAGSYATVGGGWGNEANTTFTTVGGGCGNAASGDNATIGGGDHNTTSADYTTIGGGGWNSAGGWGATVGGGITNTVSGDYAIISGGRTNIVSGTYATVSGGRNHSVSRSYGTVGGGERNIVTGYHATIAGGRENTASGDLSTIGGGWYSIVSADRTVVAGGAGNEASAPIATVGGGEGNTASGLAATVSGGWINTASGNNATVPGGEFNTAQGNNSFAAGTQAQANHQGAFVWADSSNFAFTSTVDNEFSVRSTGGARFVSAIDGSGSPVAGVILNPGAGSWASLSDREVKENFAPVDGVDILDRLAQVPVTTWNYKSQDPSVRHMGPMAQDFYAAFGLGEDSAHISTVDADGVALAAIQGFYAQNQALAAENAALRQELDDLEGRVAALEAAAAGGTASTPSWQSTLLPGAGILLAAVGLVWVVRRGGGR